MGFNSPMKTISAPTCWAHIWIAGNPARIEDLCRSFAWHFPTCVAVTPTAYCYTGSTQRGACVRLLNYPPHPRSAGGELTSIRQEADKLARHLLYSLDEKSCTVELPDTTYYIERPVVSLETTPEDYIGGDSSVAYRAVDEDEPEHEELPDPRKKWVPPVFDRDGTIMVDHLGRKVPNCS